MNIQADAARLTANETTPVHGLFIDALPELLVAADRPGPDFQLIDSEIDRRAEDRRASGLHLSVHDVPLRGDPPDPRGLPVRLSSEDPVGVEVTYQLSKK